MNPLYDQFFNSQYTNADYLRQLQWQHHDAEQCREIMNIVKAIMTISTPPAKSPRNTSRRPSMPASRPSWRK